MSRSRALFAMFLAAALLTAGGAEAARRRAVHSTEPEFNVAFTQGGYADRTSVAQGAPIALHIATSVTPFVLRVVNLARPQDVLLTRTLTSAPRNCSGRGTSGCGWPVTTVVDVPRSWTTGYYAATFPTGLGDRSIIFVVRNENPGTWSRTVVISSTHTYQAYNDYGGKSLYPSDDPTRLTHLSFDRPYSQEAGLGRYPKWEKYFVDWMTQENRRFEVITDTDLEDPTILSRYDVVVLAGHSEYWTAAARAQLEQFSRSGGHIAVFGGNTMWWQVRVEDNARTIVGYKGFDYDPALGGERRLVTTNWFAPPVNQPENRLLGASHRHGGFANKLNTNPRDFDLKPVEQRTPWTVTDSQHWVFSRTGLANGSTFGREIAGLEVDGVVFNCGINGNVLGAEGSDEAPLNYHILAVVPATMGWGTMGLFVNSAGGAVFNGASQGFLWGLESSPIVRTIVENVLNRFEPGAPLPYDPVQTNILAQDTFNCPATLIAQPGWRGNVGRGTTTSSCAYEGPGGLELSGNGVIAIARNVVPVGSEGRDHLELRFYVKADEAEQRVSIPMPIVTLRQGAGGAATGLAHVEIDKVGETKRIRLARRGPDGFHATEFITLANGWHLVEATWRSPGTLALQVDGGQTVTIENPFSGQRVQDFVVELPATALPNGGRVCIDAIAAGTAKLGAVPALQ